MARKNVVESFRLLDQVSLATNHTSNTIKETSVLKLDKASIHVTWTDPTATGTITVEAMNGDPRDLAQLETWYELNFGSPLILDGSDDEMQIVFNEMPFDHIRINYTATTGTGTLTATLTSKTVGA